ncbi:hypothetical protein EXM22_02045 [Oceanispirochaeta crateris]|uniref:Uncharacterized protein n=1 Tax=Oceanispirochaeta crateris TaxID=2518645 RepID=A0A5C1QGZ5_9SPIO|nr:hypothetical protein [Oceanispirochaeta crateris]QEN06831.1 hypothetical protein EXM22_02045 [Oceanispirochaeta crateris]
MYSIELINILKAIPELSHQNFSKIDNLLGSVGTGGIFRKSELLRVVSQKSLISKIEAFLIQNTIIQPYKKNCPTCGNEYAKEVDKCDYCDTDLTNPTNISYFKIVAEIQLSNDEKKVISQKKMNLDISAFKLLIRKIERIKRTQRNGYLVLFDLANSTEIRKENMYFHSLLCKQFNSFIKEFVRPYFLKSNAIVVKSEGDSAFVFFTNQDDLESFIMDYHENIKFQDFYNKMIEFNEDNKVKSYIKTYISASDVSEYHQTDMLSLDFESMEAFTFINRIEKIGKSKLVESYGENDLIPYFILSRTEIFPSKEFMLSNVQNYGNVNVYLSLSKDIDSTISR